MSGTLNLRAKGARGKKKTKTYYTIDFYEDGKWQESISFFDTARDALLYGKELCGNMRDVRLVKITRELVDEGKPK